MQSRIRGLSFEHQGQVLRCKTSGIRKGELVLQNHTIRYCKNFVFPPYEFLPGINPHPNHAGGYRFGISDPEAEMISHECPEKNQSLCFSVDLFNHEYFWESHIYLEALWNAHGRKGSEAYFLKGMIKLAAAGVKIKKAERTSARIHLKSARSYFAKVMKAEGPEYLGFSMQNLRRTITLSLKLGCKLFEVHPSWSKVERKKLA